MHLYCKYFINCLGSLTVMFIAVTAVWYSFNDLMYTPPCCRPDNPFKVTHVVWFDIEFYYNPEKPVVMGSIKFQLYGNIAPIAAKNFYELATGQHGYGYRNTPFHRTKKGFMIQGGNIGNNGGKSIYQNLPFSYPNSTNAQGEQVNIFGLKDTKFPDEGFKMKHNQTGTLSMANFGPDSNKSMFFITMIKNASWCDGVHQAFGKVQNGLWIVKEIAEISTDQNNRPIIDIMVRDSGGEEMPSYEYN